MPTKSFSLHFTLAVYAEASCSLDPQTLQLGQEGSGVQLKGLWSKVTWLSALPLTKSVKTNVKDSVQYIETECKSNCIRISYISLSLFTHQSCACQVGPKKKRYVLMNIPKETANTEVVQLIFYTNEDRLCGNLCSKHARRARIWRNSRQKTLTGESGIANIIKWCGGGGAGTTGTYPCKGKCTFL